MGTIVLRDRKEPQCPLWDEVVSLDAPLVKSSDVPILEMADNLQTLESETASLPGSVLVSMRTLPAADVPI